MISWFNLFFVNILYALGLVLIIILYAFQCYDELLAVLSSNWWDIQLPDVGCHFMRHVSFIVNSWITLYYIAIVTFNSTHASVFLDVKLKWIRNVLIYSIKSLEVLIYYIIICVNSSLKVWTRCSSSEKCWDWDTMFIPLMTWIPSWSNWR